MTDHEKTTEELIFSAAQQVFIQKGFEGARMQEIATVAGINKALLHYYYRTKEKLFAAIFDRIVGHILPRVISFLESDTSVMEKIEFFVHTYIDLLLRNPFIPQFILNEINRNPEKIAETLTKHVNKIDAFGKFFAMVNDEIKKGNIRPIAPEQLLVNMLSLCIFPFVARPIIQGVFFKNDKAQYLAFIESRKKDVTEFIIRAIKIEK